MSMFKKDFVFGAATASFQIEGASKEDGKCDSIWDTFCRTPGKVANGDTGDVACDHYHRYKEDVALMKELGIDSYRFSIAWPRIFPEPHRYNPKGMEFYKNLIKELRGAGIEPAVTLYHWDMPQWMEDMGGWTNREVVDHFVEFATTCFKELGKDVNLWITHNEPFCAAILGYQTGVHAPGIQSVQSSLEATHHMLLSHGKVVELFRKMNLSGEIGITLNLTPVKVASDSYEDAIGANNFDGFINRWFLSPIFKKSYPMDMVNLYQQQGARFSFVKPGDLECIGVDTDFLGINYYSGACMGFDESNPMYFKGFDMGKKKTAMEWEITPEMLYDFFVRLRKEYTNLPIIITENGSAFQDTVASDGSVQDSDRVEYLNDHIEAFAKIHQDNLGLVGYYAWSFMDNFEWAFGYEKRFGIVHIDFETQKRTPKASFYRYQEIIRELRG